MIAERVSGLSVCLNTVGYLIENHVCHGLCS